MFGKIYFGNSFHDGGSYHIETSLLICTANQGTGFYTIGTSVVKEVKITLKKSDPWINFIKNELLDKWYWRILRLFMEASTYRNMVIILSKMFSCLSLCWVRKRNFNNNCFFKCYVWRWRFNVMVWNLVNKEWLKKSN